MILALLVAALPASAAGFEADAAAALARAVPEASVCVRRVVESMGAGETAWTRHAERAAPLSASMIGKVWGFYDVFRHDPAPWQNVVFQDLELKRGSLSARATVEVYDPASGWTVTAERRVRLKPGRAEVFHSRVGDRTFRDTVTLAVEPDLARCVAR